MTMKIALLFTIMAISSLVDCRPTHCERWKGDSEFRCGKDDYKADTVTIRNRSGRNISFKVGMWLSQCGRPGQNYANHDYSLHPKRSVTVNFGEVGPGYCNELFVYDCKIDNRGSNCLDTVTVTPNL